MNDETREEHMPEAEIDCGEPVPELVALQESPSVSFNQRVSRGIGRRRLAAEFTQVSVQMPFFWLMEILNIMFHFFTGKITEKGGPNSG